MPISKKIMAGFMARRWRQGPTRTAGEYFEWDVQLSNTGRTQLGWLSRDGNHINVSWKGHVTHK